MKQPMPKLPFTELADLKDRARQAAEARGHNLRPWGFREFGYTTNCRVCLAELDIRTGDKTVAGSALETECKFEMVFEDRDAGFALTSYQGGTVNSFWPRREFTRAKALEGARGIVRRLRDQYGLNAVLEIRFRIRRENQG